MSQQTWYAGGRRLVAAYARHQLDLQVARQAPLPDGPKLIVANHPTTTDPVLVPLACAEPLHILITGMCFRIPVLSTYLRRAGHVPVVAGQRREAFDAALRLLSEGRNVLIFSEGALSPWTGGVHPLRSGTARLALLTGAPVVPIGIALHRERILRIDIARFYLHGPYAMTMGAPQYFSGDARDRERVAAVSAQVREQIVALARQSARRLPAPPQSGGPAWRPIPQPRRDGILP